MIDELSLLIASSVSTYVETSQIRRTVNEVLKYAGVSDQATLTIVFEEDELLRQMNEKYLGIDAPTDVLSFPTEYIDPETNENYLGDILISVPRAIDQAAAGNHPVEDELQLLVIHGLLHLLGYDHMEEEDKERMQKSQSEILRRLGNRLEITL